MFISVAIPYFNSFHFIKDTLQHFLKDERINDIVITDDKSKPEDLLKLKTYVNSYPKIRLFENNTNIGVLRNKLKSVSLCKNFWIILCDADNIMLKDYVDAIYNQRPWNKDLIYAPSWAKTFPRPPSENLNYKKYENKIIDSKEVVRLQHLNNFRCLINNCNYFCNKNICNFVDLNKFIRKEMSCIDTFYINKSWLKNKKKIKIVPNMTYRHRLHKQSNYVMTNNNKSHRHQMSFYKELEKIQ